MNRIDAAVEALKTVAAGRGFVGPSSGVVEHAPTRLTAAQLSRVGREQPEALARAFPADWSVSYAAGLWLVRPAADARRLRRIAPGRREIVDAGDQLHAAVSRYEDDQSPEAHQILRAARRRWAKVSTQVWRAAEQLELEITR